MSTTLVTTNGSKLVSDPAKLQGFDSLSVKVESLGDADYEKIKNRIDLSSVNPETIAKNEAFIQKTIDVAQEQAARMEQNNPFMH